MKLKIRDYKKLTGLQIDVDGLVGIVGANGSGKSTIINAVRSLAYNVAGDPIRWGAESAAVALVAEESLMWKRAGGAAHYIFRDKKYEKLGRVVPEEISEFLNMEPIQVEDEKHFVNFFMQLDAPLVVKLSPSRLYSLIVKSLDADKIEKASKSIERYILAEKEELRDLETREHVYKQDRVALEKAVAKTADLDVWKTAFANYETAQILHGKLVEYKAILGETEGLAKRLQVVETSLARVEKALSVESRLESDRNLLLGLKGVKSRFLPVKTDAFLTVDKCLISIREMQLPEEVQRDLDVLRRIRSTVVFGANSKCKLVISLEEGVDKLLLSYPNNLGILSDLRLRWKDIVERRGKVTEEVDELKRLTSGSVCPTCGRGLEEL